MGGALIEAAGWGWRHAGRRDAAVRGLDLRVEPGERVLLLGASGAGKSTLLAGLAGLLGGEDEGVEIGRLRVDGRAPAEQRGRIGLVLQDPDAQAVASRVGDDVAFGCENLGLDREEIWRRVGWALDEVALRVPLDRRTAALSGGQKQRLALAGVLAMRPGLLLLDEPTANLDPAGVAEVREAVGRVTRETGATLVVVEHRTEVWADLATRVIVLGTEGIVADGRPDAVFGRHGGQLAAAGVWVPRMPMPLRSAPPGSGRSLLTGDELAVGRQADAPVLEGLSIAVPEASALVITGPNGVGKSTLGLTLAGLLPEVGGVLRSAPELAGRRGTRPIDWRSRELLTRVGMVFQEPEHQFLRASLADELAVGPRALGWPEEAVAARVQELLDRLELTRLAQANPFTLSGGQKRRLSVGTALAAAPSILVLDEPTFGQDRRTWIALMELLLEQIDAGRSIVAVTHDAEVARVLGSQRLELRGAGERAAA